VFDNYNLRAESMNNDQIKLLSLAIVGGCGVISFGLGQKEAMPVCALVTLAALVFFLIKYKTMKP
jgi:hypothetical protein